MELTDRLKERVEGARNRQEVKELIEEAGIQLTDEELDRVSSGTAPRWGTRSKDPFLNPSR